jgi:hypothetical protein
MLLFEEEFVQLLEQKIVDVKNEIRIRQMDIAERATAIYALENAQRVAERCYTTMVDVLRQIQAYHHRAPRAHPFPPSPRPAS